MKIIFPMPWLSLALLAAWPLMLNDTSNLVLIGAVLMAIILPLMTRRFVPDLPVARRPLMMIRLGFLVFYDIVKSNIIVARQVLGNVDDLKPIFVTVPLQTDHGFVLTLLASIITMTPGTVSARVVAADESERSYIVVHALSCDDGPALIKDIQDRYEKPLLEIFGC